MLFTPVPTDKLDFAIDIGISIDTDIDIDIYL